MTTSTTFARQKSQEQAPLPPLGLSPYIGPWTIDHASHLLRRGMFGPNYEQIKWSTEVGLTATIQKLFEEIPLPAPPVNPAYNGDNQVDIGDTWINARYSQGSLVDEMEYRERSLYGWTFGRMLEEGISIRETLTLFWHNHFPIQAILDPKYVYRYSNLLRSHAWGNFRELTKEITVDPSMLIYLNGKQNSGEEPNENYARELLELFTIGKGPQIGPGDYTNYTEEDVKQFARVLSGWRDYGFTTHDSDGDFGAEFYPSRHDNGTKVLSDRFNNEEIPNMGDQEYKRLIDIIFDQSEVAKFICRKLYRWFVFHEISPETESDVIIPMATSLIANDYEIRPTLISLLSSEHFFDAKFQGVMIKNPLEFMMSIYKNFDISISNVLDEKYYSWYRLYGFTELMQMTYYSVPQVAGWSAYYRSPLFYRDWINASTLPLRMNFSDTMINEGIFPFQANGPKMKVDVLAFITTIDNPNNPNAVIEEFARILFPKPLSQAKRDYLKAVLIPGLPDFEWTAEYGSYAADPENSQLANAVRTKLRTLLKTMLKMSEFYLN
ncbi:MAG: hypothetical protein DHS20C18_46990 [Saprospiraceae bacterium]|nr:MAG: hypothetical protein DHS20C18_46990 [Saprospiraceae bacterium]